MLRYFKLSQKLRTPTMSEPAPTPDTEADADGRTFRIDESELDAILGAARDRADAVEHGTHHHSDDRFGAGLRAGAEHVHRAVIERGDLVDTTE